MIKRFVLVLALTLILATLLNLNNTLYNTNSTEIYLSKNSSECQIISRENLTLFDRIKGESYYITEDFNLNNELKKLNATLVFSEKITGYTNYYAYSKDIKLFTKINGRKVNVHFSVGEKVKVGIPFIYGAY